MAAAVLCCTAPRNPIQRRALGPSSANRRLERAHLASELAGEAEVPMQDVCKRMSEHRCAKCEVSSLPGWLGFFWLTSLRDSVHHGRGGLVTGAGVSWSHCVHSQKAEKTLSPASSFLSEIQSRRPMEWCPMPI